MTSLRMPPARLRRKRGQGMTEYIIVIAIIAIGAILIIGVFGKQIKSTFGRISKALSGEEEAAATVDIGDVTERDTLGNFEEGADE